MKTECMRPAMKGEPYVLRGEVVRMARQVAYGEATVRDADGALVSRATGTFLLHRPDPEPAPPPDPYRVPPPGPGVCLRLLRPPGRPRAVCFACRSVAAASASRSSPVLPVRLCPLPSPLYAVLMGYKESPVAEARARFAPMVRLLFDGFLAAHAGCLAAAAGGPVDLVLPVPSTARPGGAPLARRGGPGRVRHRPDGRALVARPARTRAARPVGHMQPDRAAFAVAAASAGAVPGRRVLLLDDTYVSGARAQSAAAALRRAGARSVVIVALGRVLRRTASPLHAAFLAAVRRRRRRGPGAAVLPLRSDGGADRVAHAGQLLGRPPQRGRRLVVPGPAERRATRRAEELERCAGPMYCPARTDDEVAAHRTGRAPAAADCPSVVPAVPASLRRSRLSPRAAPLPGQVAAGPAGVGRHADVGRPAASAAGSARGEEEVGQLGRAVGHPACCGVRPRRRRRAERPTRCMWELTVTTRERSVVTIRSSSRPVSAKWPEVVGGHLELEPVGRLAVRRAHHAGVVDEDVEPGVLGQDGSAARRTETRSARSSGAARGGAVELALELVAGPARLLLVAAGHDHVRAVVGQAPRRLVADAAVGAGDERDPAGQVTDVVGAPGAPPVASLPGIAAHALPMWSAGTVPSLPASKSSKAWTISARVFMTKGPWA